MSAFHSVAETRIRKALAEGKFERLPGAGQPIDLEWYFALPEDVRLAYGLLKSNNCAPQEVEIRREIAALEEAFENERDADQRKSLARRIADGRLRLDLLIEQQRRSSRSR
jgi:DnaJ-like protein